MRNRNVTNVVLGRKFGIAALAVVFAAFVFSCYTLSDVQAKQTTQIGDPSSVREIGATEENTYVGNSSCEKCHANVTSSQSATSMAKAAFDPKGNPPDTDYSQMAYREGEYTARIVPQREGLYFSVSNRQGSLSAPIRWIFGRGVMGQTFVLEYEGRYYESRASYYSKIRNLDLTIGHAKSVPTSLLAALGRPLPQAEIDKCFSCHTSEDIFSGKLNLEKVHPGITCENCHGPGSSHVAGMEGPHGQSAAGVNIFDPGELAPADINDFCGSCHRTTRDVLDSRIRDVRNIRFQPYRLENSRCYDPSDARITCIACHNPHRELNTDLASYDSKCLACHANGEQIAKNNAPACPKATRNCVSCHMPKLTLPGAHFAFTDHYIRVNHPDQPYPD